MDRIEFKSKFTVEPVELNDAQKNLADGIKNRFLSLSTFGVVERESSNHIVYTGSDGSIGIYGFVAYNNEGERIEIPIKLDDMPTLVGLKPLYDTDGLLSVYGTNFSRNKTYILVARYKSDYDYTKPTSSVVTQELSYKYIKSGYEFYIRVPNISTIIEANLKTVQPGDIQIAQLTIDDDGQITADESIKDIAYVDATSVVGTMDSEFFEKQPFQENIKDQSFQEHINCVGTGTVTARNIHGLSAEDLGIDLGATGNHQRLLHTSGIRTDNLASTTSALYPYYGDETATNDAFVYICGLTTANNECCTVNGINFYQNDFPSLYTHSFSSMGSESYAGYYWFYLDSTSRKINYVGPGQSENDSIFLRLLNDPTKFPICSCKWALINYHTDGVLQQNYGIVPGTFLDRRKFNNTSIKTFRPDDIFAITQFAPVANDISYLHNARVIGTNAYGRYNVIGKNLIVKFGPDPNEPTKEVAITFTGTAPDMIIDNLLTAFIDTDTTGTAYLRAYPRFTKDGFLSISSAEPITITGTAAEEFGLSTGTTYYYDNIQEMIYLGERNGYITFVYENPTSTTDQGNLTLVEYHLGGGLIRYHKFIYDNDGVVIRVQEGLDINQNYNSPVEE